MNGIVKKWDKVRGRGFANPIDRQGDCFIHYTDILDRGYLEVGNEVSFDIQETPKDRKTINVIVIEA
jgi:cold shock CspA family protein